MNIRRQLGQLPKSSILQEEKSTSLSIGRLLLIIPSSLALIPTSLISSGRSKVSFLVFLPLETTILARPLPIRLLMSLLFGESIKYRSPYYYITLSTYRKLIYIGGLAISHLITPQITI